MSLSSTYDSTVNSFYLAFYGRPADPAGLKFWSQQLAGNNGDLGAITRFFAASEEAQVRFGTDSVAERIAEIYQSLFNRAPEAGGLTFWTNAVEQGHASLADVSISILKGAQGSDAALSTLRQQAADDFTAHVEAAGSQYDGYAAIEAARILVRAVTADATADDLAALVNAAVSFADTATKNPKVVDAIAVNTTLLALFDTARGVKEPVALAKALADTAKAAAGDPVTLESLLRGGGMDKVLKVMPANATLGDVVDALAKGGLPAAVEVVYPTAPVVTPPVAAMAVAFKSVAQGVDDIRNDLVTNVEKAKVEFTLSKALGDNERVQYSVDGTHWLEEGLSITNSGSGRVVTITEVDLTQGTALNPPPPRLAEGSVMELIGNSNLATTVYLRVVGSNGTVAEASKTIELDNYAESPYAWFRNAHFDQHLNPDGDIFVNNAQHELVNLEQGARVFYKAVEIEYGRGAPAPIVTVADLLKDGWSTKAPQSTEDYNVYQVRQVDVSGNVSEASQVSFVLDTKAPSAPTITLAQDTGSDSEDAITSNGTILITGLEKSQRTGWEYSTDQGKTWEFGGVNGTSGDATLNLTKPDTESLIHLQVRQFDAAGNVSALPSDLTFTLDTVKPHNTLGFVGITGETRGSFATNSDHTALTVAMAAGSGAAVQWRVKDGGEWALATDNGDDTFTTGTIDLTTSDPLIQVRVLDLAGNASDSVEQLIDGKFGNTPPPPPPVPPTVGFAGFAMTGVPSMVFLNASTGSIVAAPGEGNAGLLNRSGLYLEQYAEGTYRATAENYLDGDNFGMLEGGMLRFDAQLQTGLYRVNWLDDVISTTNGAMSSGVLLFAGGGRGPVLQEGFAVKEVVSLEANTDAGPESTSYAYSYSSWTAYTIFTGTGHDVIIDNGGTLDIGYRSFKQHAQDLIIGFDTGDDQISLHDAAAMTIDANHDGTIEWAFGQPAGAKLAVDATTEAAEIVINGLISTSTGTHDVAMTLQSLNDALDLADMKPNGDLLILAKTGDGKQGALFHFFDANGDKTIDDGELTVFALFDNNAPVRDDIIVVGSGNLD